MASSSSASRRSCSARPAAVSAQPVSRPSRYSTSSSACELVEVLRHVVDRHVRHCGDVVGGREALEPQAVEHEQAGVGRTGHHPNANRGVRRHRPMFCVDGSSVEPRRDRVGQGLGRGRMPAQPQRGFDELELHDLQLAVDGHHVDSRVQRRVVDPARARPRAIASMGGLDRNRRRRTRRVAPAPGSRRRRATCAPRAWPARRRTRSTARPRSRPRRGTAARARRPSPPARRDPLVSRCGWFARRRPTPPA